MRKKSVDNIHVSYMHFIYNFLFRNIICLPNYEKNITISLSVDIVAHIDDSEGRKF